MKSKIKNNDPKKKLRKCRVCSTRRGLIRKYGMNLCRRCFKDRAEKIGFKKQG